MKASEVQINQIFRTSDGSVFQAVKRIKGTLYVKGIKGPLAEMKNCEGGPATANFPANRNVELVN